MLLRVENRHEYDDIISSEGLGSAAPGQLYAWSSRRRSHHHASTCPAFHHRQPPALLQIRRALYCEKQCGAGNEKGGRDEIECAQRGNRHRLLAA